VCGDSVLQTTVFQIFGPYPGFAFARLFPLYEVDPVIPLTEINMNWDHTCNVVVLQPKYYMNGTLITTKQVSEYDSQVRPQIDYEFDPTDCENCWKKVPGTSALDYGSWKSIWNPELNCGDSCILYTLEEHLVNGEVTPPRTIIGRSFRTNTLAFNITDSIHVQSLCWSPYQGYNSGKNQFIGIGICCTENWCHPDCVNLDSHLVMFSFMPYQEQNEISILADIGVVIDPDTIRLGVEFSSLNPNSKHQAYVFYQQMVVGYDLVVQDSLIVSVKFAQQSPKLDVEMITWAGGSMF